MVVAVAALDTILIAVAVAFAFAAVVAVVSEVAAAAAAVVVFVAGAVVFVAVAATAAAALPSYKVLQLDSTGICIYFPSNNRFFFPVPRPAQFDSAKKPKRPVEGAQTGPWALQKRGRRFEKYFVFFACCAPHKLFQVQDFTKPQHLAKILKIFRLREEFVTEAKERISKVIRESGGYDDNVTLVCGHVRLGDYGRHISIKGGSGSGFANATYFRRAMDHFVFNLKVRHFTRFPFAFHTRFLFFRSPTRSLSSSATTLKRLENMSSVTTERLPTAPGAPAPAPSSGRRRRRAQSSRGTSPSTSSTKRLGWTWYASIQNFLINRN